MRNQLILFFILIIALPVQGQFRMGAGAIGGWDYTGRILINTSTEPIIEAIYNKRQAETSKSNYQAGINFQHRLTEKIWLLTGFKLASVGYRDRKFEDLLWPSEVDQNGNYKRDPSLPHESQFHYDYMMLTLPIHGRYYFNEKRFSPFIEAGLGISYYAATRETETTDIYKLSDFFVVEDFRKINTSIDLGFGFQYMLMEDFALYIQPSGRFYFSRLVAKAPIKEYLYAGGVAFGFTKFFGEGRGNELLKD